jgi:DNA-binding NarL/FixJ family response regulator
VAGDPRDVPVITVVLADDYHLFRQGLRCLLETEKDLEVVGEVADGLKVVDLVERRKPRVLVVAMAMSGLNGFEVTRRVRERVPGTGVIVLSMYGHDHYIIEALRSGASGYVVTQARGIELIRAIRKVAAGRRHVSAPLSRHTIETWLQRARSATLDPYETLTSREREVFHLVCEGHSNASIASRLSISRRTAESHRANVMRKLQLSNQVELIRFAIARGVFPPPGDAARRPSANQGQASATPRGLSASGGSRPSRLRDGNVIDR